MSALPFVLKNFSILGNIDNIDVFAYETVLVPDT